MNIDPKLLAERLISGLNDFVTSDKDFEKYEKEMLEHMRKKYGIELQVDWSDRTVYKNRFDSWNCSIKGTTDEAEKGKIEVIRWRNRKNEPYEDNYYPNVIVGEIENRVHKALDGQIGEYKAYVYSRNDYVDNKFYSINQLEEYLKDIGNKTANYYISIYIPDYFHDENFYEKHNFKIIKKLKIANIGRCYCNMYFVNEKIYNQIGSNINESELKENNKKAYNKRIRKCISKSFRMPDVDLTVKEDTAEYECF